MMGKGRESKPVAASQRSATPERQQQQPTTNERLLAASQRSATPERQQQQQPTTREATATTYNQ